MRQNIEFLSPQDKEIYYQEVKNLVLIVNSIHEESLSKHPIEEMKEED